MKLDRANYAVCLGAIVLISLAHKLLYLSGFSAFALNQSPFVQPDSRGYYEPALTLAQSFQYHSPTRTPGYPALLALIYRITQDFSPISLGNMKVILGVQILLTALGCVPLALATARLTRLKWLSLVVALLWAVHNAAMYYSTRVLTEAIAAGLVCWLMYFVVQAEMTRRHRWFVFECLTLMSLILIRPSFSLMPIPLALVQLTTWWFGSERPRKLSSVSFVLASVLILPLLAQSGWAFRNRISEGDSYYCRLSTFGFWAYSIESAIDIQQGTKPRLAVYHEEFEDLLPKTTASQMDALYRQRIWQRLKTEPLAIGKYFAINSVRLLFPRSPDSGYKTALERKFWTTAHWQERFTYFYYLLNSFLELVTTCLCLLLIALAALRHFRSLVRPEFGFLFISLTAIVYWWALHANANAASRFLLPLQPLLLIAAANSYAVLKTGRNDSI